MSSLSQIWESRDCERGEASQSCSWDSRIGLSGWGGKLDSNSDQGRMPTQEIRIAADEHGGLEETSYALQAHLRRSHLRYTQTEATVDQHHFAAGDNFVPHYEINWIGDVTIEFNHITGA